MREEQTREQAAGVRLQERNHGGRGTPCAHGCVDGIAGPTLFSPGSLSAKTSGRTLGGVTSHAQTGGACSACHSEPWSSQDMAYRCMRCHTNIGAQIRTKQGVHGLLLGKSGSPTCRGCHTEHLGPNGAVTRLDEKTFPHDLTGYSLNGHQTTVKGPAFTCRDCHGTDVSRFDRALCARCHAGIDAKFMTAHEASFGSNCLLCHKGSGRDGIDFDHNRFAFKLTGAHARVECVRCHSRAGAPQALAGIPTDCYSCHTKDNVHGTMFGKDCGRCHNTAGWTVAAFNHASLPRNLASVDCHTCHAENDTHQGKLGRRCGECHNTSGWSRAVFDHSRLSGGSASQDCNSCHAKDDRHGGTFGQQCGQCHDTSSWSGSTFSHTGFPISHGGAEGCATCHPKGTSTYTCYGCHAHTLANVQARHGGRSARSLVNCVQCHAGAGGGRGGDGRGSRGEGRGGD